MAENIIKKVKEKKKAGAGREYKDFILFTNIYNSATIPTFKLLT